MKLTFKRCEQTDLKELVSISRSTYYHSFIADNSQENMKLYLDAAFSNDTLSSEIANKNSVFYFAYLMGVVVGYFKLNWGDAQKDVHDDKAVEIERIYVLKEFQRKRLGQQMLEKAIDLSRDRNAEFIWLGVWERNIKAIRFYERNGFKTFGDHIFMLGNDEQRDILMKRPL